MANPILLLILLLLSSNCLIATSQLLETSSNPIDFIKQSCNTTLYPTLCFKCLSSYANSIKPPNQEKRLAQAALQVSLTRAQSASISISKLSRSSSSSKKEFQAVKDCFDTLGDSVDELSQSVKELSQSPVLNNNPSFSWHMSNVRTWVSAALTDDTTCLDGFSDQSINSDGSLIRDEIKAKVNDVAQVTSIALAFVTSFANGYQGVTLAPTTISP